MFNLTQSIANQIADKKLVIGMLLDISKAYDCLDRDLLLFKLKKYGKMQKVGLRHTWMMVQVTKNKEKYLLATLASSVGIAPDNILGSVLFVIFINVISSLSNPPHRQ